jgi:hypothetical protein
MRRASHSRDAEFVSLITSLASTGTATGLRTMGSRHTMPRTTQLLPYPVFTVPPACRHSHEWSALGCAPYLYETSLPGAFAVGDVRVGSVKRVAAAADEGSMALRLVQQYLGLVPT